MAAEYASLRLIDVVHKLRYGVQPKLVEANGEQTITYRNEPFAHFDVQPSGVQIPIHNVASAIPKEASVAAKMNRTVGAMKAAREAKQAKAHAAVMPKRGDDGEE